SLLTSSGQASSLLRRSPAVVSCRASFATSAYCASRAALNSAWTWASVRPSTSSAAQTVASPPLSVISRASHWKSSRAASLSGSAYTEFLIAIAPCCCRRLQTLTRSPTGLGGSWCISRSHLGPEGGTAGLGNNCYKLSSLAEQLYPACITELSGRLRAWSQPERGSQDAPRPPGSLHSGVRGVLRLAPLLNPSPKEVDLVLRPRPVAGHGSAGE